MYSTPRLLAMSFNLLGFLCRVFRFDERLARVQHAQIISVTIVPCAALAGLRMVTGKLYNPTAAANIRGLDVKFKRFSLKFELGPKEPLRDKPNRWCTFLASGSPIPYSSTLAQSRLFPWLNGLRCAPCSLRLVPDP